MLVFNRGQKRRNRKDVHAQTQNNSPTPLNHLQDFQVCNTKKSATVESGSPASGPAHLHFANEFFMRTEKQIAASRANGRKSNGAATPDGKARIVAANLKSGVYAESETLPWENAKDLEPLKAEDYDHHQPASLEARLLVDELISCEWTLRRHRRADSNLCDYSTRQIYKPDEEYAAAQAFLRSDKAFVRL